MRRTLVAGWAWWRLFAWWCREPWFSAERSRACSHPALELSCMCYCNYCWCPPTSNSSTRRTTTVSGSANRNCDWVSREKCLVTVVMSFCFVPERSRLRLMSTTKTFVFAVTSELELRLRWLLFCPFCAARLRLWLPVNIIFFPR